MARSQRLWLLTIFNFVLGGFLLSRGEMIGIVLGILLLALAAFTTVLAWRGSLRA